MHRLGLKALAAATAATLALTLAPAAHAERVSLDDGADATASTTDIRQVRVNHGKRWVRTVVSFPNLRKGGDASLSIYFDTRGRRKGPEYGVGLPLFSGADYMLMRRKNWKQVGQPVDCSYRGRFDWAGDRVIFMAHRGCFGKPDRLRVGMRMVDWADDDHQVRDWLIGRRDWTRWLDRGTPAA